MNKIWIFLKNFFAPFSRQELALEKYWWHRLARIAFVLLLSATLYHWWWAPAEQWQIKRQECYSADNLGFEDIDKQFDFCDMVNPNSNGYNLRDAVFYSILMSYFLQFLYYKILLYIVFGKPKR